MMTVEDLEAFCKDRRISGGYVRTSAQDGSGLEQLIARIRREIPWDGMATTVTTSTFDWIKKYVLGLKAERTSAQILVTVDRLHSS